MGPGPSTPGLSVTFQRNGEYESASRSISARVGAFQSRPTSHFLLLRYRCAIKPVASVRSIVSRRAPLGSEKGPVFDIRGRIAALGAEWEWFEQGNPHIPDGLPVGASGLRSSHQERFFR